MFHFAKKEKNIKIFVISGTGRVGNFLVPKLLKNRHDVYVGARGQFQKRDCESLEGLKFITVNARDNDSLEALKGKKFDVIIDFPGTAKRVGNVLAENVSHVIACESLWMFGYPKILPTPEISFEKCFDKGYEIRFDDMLKMQAESGNGKAIFTAIMQPNICRSGKILVDQYCETGLRRTFDLQTERWRRGDYLPRGCVDERRV